MIHQRYKDLYFLGLSKATLPNYYLRRTLSRIRGTNGRQVHLHLGCGPNYLPGFVNVDANPGHKIDLWLDVRNGLPYPDGSVASIYTTHVLEHFFPDELARLLAECYRVLCSGGGMRIIVPSLRTAIEAYNRGEVNWFSAQFPRPYDSLGGRFVNFIFCDGQHRSAFDFTHMQEMLRRAGFAEVTETAEGQSVLYGDKVLSYDPGDREGLPRSLYVEAFKK
ncbi:MAG: class I SAM-dependent methyltransferase [Terriglobales bacterium]